MPEGFIPLRIEAKLDEMAPFDLFLSFDGEDQSELEEIDIEDSNLIAA